MTDHRQNVTFWVIVGTALWLLLYDLWAYWRWGPEGTVSHELSSLAGDYPFVALLAGLLVGHWFWSSK